ncbi:solute carrier family 12 member 2-like [Tachypleus tridentatus]|uniref:solute carrier family 12 member 2-like n=1 Tax=Tachypleus tridentatus TaxID=6853 RepID=UPI003FD68867
MQTSLSDEKSRFNVANLAYAYENPLVQSRSPDDTESLDTKSIREIFVGVRRRSRDPDAQPANKIMSGDTIPILEHDILTNHYATHDAIPRVEHYLNSVDRAISRPTLDELRTVPANSYFSSKYDCDNQAEGGSEAVKFGWIRGVFLRCLLNIWGVMLFLRMGWMTAEAGIGLAIVIVLLATVVTILTTMSMAAICTNGEVKGGGAYFMISRTLGPAFGGSIGIVFSFANCVAVAMYIVGAAETVRDLLQTFDAGFVEYPSSTNDVRVAGILLLILMTGVTFVGMAFENKAQIFLLILLLMSLMDYFVGACLNPTLEQRAKGFVGWNLQVATKNFGPDFRGESFFSVFSVFFPSVTGILAGANISGDLRDASVAIPKGTFIAIITTSISYILIIIWLGFTLVRDATGNVEDVLNGNFTNCAGRTCAYGMSNYIQVMEMSSGFGPLIYVGIFAATLSSALAALISAPRIFQAVCKDNIFPYIHFFAKSYGKDNDPRRAAVLTFIIALLCTIIGELNIIAPIISNFFMANYCLINFSCFHLAFIKSPGFRPSFTFFNKWASLVGALLCVSVMFIMNWITAVITFIVVLALYIYVDQKKPDINWGCSTEAAIYKSALTAVSRLNRVQDHVKNFRPAILALTGNPSSRPPLVDFAYSITRKVGLLVCGHVLKGPITLPLRKAMIDHNYRWLEKRKTKGFYNVIESSNLTEGTKSLLQLCGLGKLRPNIVLMGYKKHWRTCDSNELQQYFNVINQVFDMHLALGILRLQDGLDYAQFFETEMGLPYNDTPNDPNLPTAPYDSPCNVKSVTDGDLSSERKSYTESVSDETENPKETKLPSLAKFRRLTSVEAAHYHFPEVPADVMNAVDQFQRKQKKGTIDVWWLYDDGGLTMLIPYILTTRSQWNGCKLRVFSLSHRESDLDRAQANLSVLLKKFRISFSDVTVLPGINEPPREETRLQFQGLVSKWLVDEDQSKDPLAITETVLAMHKEKSNRQMRLRELLVKHSKEASLVVLTLPIPRRCSCPAPLYMSWLELLTRDMPPLLLIRGNQTSVLTYYA